MSLRVVFQMDPLSRLNFERDSTIALIEEAQKRKHEIYYYTPAALSWTAGKLSAWGAKLEIGSNHRGPFNSETPECLDLETFDILFIRQDPPFNIEYITTTYLLDHLSEKVFMINDPEGIRQSPEKLLVTHFPDLMPPTLMTQNVSDIQDFVHQHEDVVVKPLYEFGGEGILQLKKNDPNIVPALDLFRKAYPDQPWIIQKFLPDILEGDHRLFLLDGELMGAYTRVPANNSIRSNAARGGSAISYIPNRRDQEICHRIGSTLKKRGLFFAGIDIIGSYLIEINVTSPTGLRVLDRLYSMNSASLIWDAIEQKRHTF